MNELLILLWTLFKILLIILPLIVFVAYLTTIERKVIAYMHCRVGPNTVGYNGMLQPIADAIKLLFKEIIIPRRANQYFFILAPILAIAPALAAWAVIPFGHLLVLADIDCGLLYLMAMSALGAYGFLLAGWSSNSVYAIMGSMRCAAQVISYEIGMGFALVAVLLLSKSMNLTTIVLAQSGSILNWFAWPLLPSLVVYWISAVAETNRLPFDLAEGEAEIVAGYQVEYSGITFALFFLAEYANMTLVSAVATTAFMGGWLSPFQGIPYFDEFTQWIPGLIWFALKTCFFLFLFLWFRSTFPRYRYDQLMSLGWKVLIPTALVWVIVVSFWIQLKVSV